MGTVLPFTARPGRSARRSVQRPDEPADIAAEVLLFTGVRYERAADHLDLSARLGPEGATPSPRRRKKKRA